MTFNDPFLDSLNTDEGRDEALEHYQIWEQELERLEHLIDDKISDAKDILYKQPTGDNTNE